MATTKPYPGTSNTQPDRDLIRNNPYLKTLDNEAIDYLFQMGEIRNHPKGDVLIVQGEDPKYLFISLKGKIALVARRASGERTIVEMLPSGSMFLLSSVLLRLPYVASAEASTDMRILAIPVDAFMKGLELHHALALTTLNQMAGYVRLMASQVKQLKLQNASERLAHHILARCRKDHGAAILELDDERRVIAQRLGMTPESLSRSIAALKDAGVVFDQRTVRIDDVARLREYCGLEIID